MACRRRGGKGCRKALELMSRSRTSRASFFPFSLPFDACHAGYYQIVNTHIIGLKQEFANTGVSTIGSTDNCLTSCLIIHGRPCLICMGDVVSSWTLDKVVQVTVLGSWVRHLTPMCRASLCPGV